MFCCSFVDPEIKCAQKKAQNSHNMTLLLIVSVSAAENVVLVVLRAAVMVLEQFGVDLKRDLKEKTDNYIN